MNNETPRTTKVSKVSYQAIIVKVDRRKARLLKVLCAKHGVSQTSVIRKAIDAYLDQ